ncbi:MAG: cell wall-active antibiotics response protein [Bdellovibrionales bacterium]|nr:cell wall-active antibiotics response protein [Bdellovibrionales bacterium]
MYYLGFILIGSGIIFFLNSLFGFAIPIFRILFALSLLYFGIQILFNSFGFHLKKVTTTNEALFGSSQFKLNMDSPLHRGKENKEYNTVFGDSELDLRDLDLSKGSTTISMNTVFGETRLIIKKDTPLRLHTNAVFADTNLPNSNLSRFGSSVYNSDLALENSQFTLNVDANIVFGTLSVVEK